MPLDGEILQQQIPTQYGPQIVQRQIPTQYSPQLVTSASTNHIVWRQWNSNLLSTVRTESIESGAIYSNRLEHWPFYPTTTTTRSTTSSTSTITWGIWNDRFERMVAVGDAAQLRTAQIARYSRRKLTEEELLVELEREKKMREEADRALLKAKMAEKRAEELLRFCLSDKQIEDLEKRNCFYVEIEGQSGKKERYRIDRGSHGNVKQVDARGSIIRSFCIQPEGVPNGDVLLTQKLWLEASEASREEFWATANITPLMAEKAIPHTVPRRERRRYAEVHGLLH